MTTTVIFLSLLSVLAFISGGDSTSISRNVPYICIVDGKIYRPGESFLGPDGCNTCTCSSTGAVMCTRMACHIRSQISEWLFPRQSMADCVITKCKQVHKVGESFPAGDGCNTCYCSSPKQIMCTLMACPTCVYNGEVHEIGGTFPAVDGCNICKCTGPNEFVCTLKGCPGLSEPILPGK